MIYHFGAFSLDADRVELTNGSGAPVALEPQVFALLELLIRNGDTLTTRDDIVEAVWSGRSISDAAISSRINAARAAIDDDGRHQTHIRTVHGRGFRFVTPVNRVEPVSRDCLAQRAPMSAQPSIAVLPFEPIGADPGLALLAEALPHELILHLSRLHWLVVIARASTFQFRNQEAHDDIGAALDARYVLSGRIEATARGFAASVVLADNVTRQVVWADRFEMPADDTLSFRDQVARVIVAVIDVQLPRNEALKARSAGTEQLDAWSAYHLGLNHVYRFRAKDNALAADYFRQSLALDPGFARAHAGLSFARFQDAFTFYPHDADTAKRDARSAAEGAMEIDPDDPFSNFVLGRYFWLEADLDTSLQHLERSVALNPNYAQGHYSLAWTNALANRGGSALIGADKSFRLSPIDPLLYGVFGTRALAHLHEGDTAAAADWAERAARAPGAHFLIDLMAVAMTSLNGEHDKATGWSERVKQRRGDARAAMFLKSFPFQHDGIRRQVAGSLESHGF